jgi:hypothetical protein
LEALVTAAVIFAAAVMTELPPASAAGTAGAAVASETDTPLSVIATAGGWTFDVRLTPARIGSNVFEVTVTAPSGQTVDGANASLVFTPPAGGAASELQLGQPHTGLFSATGGLLNQQGDWQMSIRLQPVSAPAPVVASAILNVGVDGVVRAAGAPLPWNVSLVIWLDQYGRVGLAAILAAGTCVWGWIASRQRQGLARAGWLAAGLLAGLALVLTVALAG